MANKEFIVRNGLIVGSNTFVVNATSNTVTVDGTIQATSIQVNGATIPSGATSNLVFDTVNTAFNVANAAFGSANNVAPQVAPAYNTANAAYSHSNTTYAAVNSAFAVINAAFASANNVAPQVAPSYNTANAAYGQANTARTHANSAFDVANAAFGSANNVAPQVAPAYNTANGGYTVANAAFGHSNVTYNAVNSVFGVANAGFDLANNKVSKSGDTITGTLNIVGDLIVSGNTRQINANTMSVSDPLIYLAANNYSSDIVDIGFIANYVNTAGANVHTGLYREHENKEYYLFQGYDREPINNHIGAFSNNMTLSVLNADIRTSNLNLGGANAITWISSGYGVANAAYGQANTLATSANAYASAVGVSANTYAATVGTSANAYAATVGASTNNYTSATYSTLAQFGSVFGVANGAFAKANTALTTSNYNSYTPTLTGTGASGTWGISVTGNAGTVTNGVYQNSYGSCSVAFTSNINANANNTAGVYGSYAASATNTPTSSGILYNFLSGPAGAGDGSQLWQDYVTNNLYARQRWGGGWGGWLSILSTSNYSSYCNFGTNSVYGGIFYDGNNTGYYVDPASTTNINALTTAGAITTSGPITASGNQNYSYTFAHGNYSRVILPAGNNGAASGDAGLYFWISEPAVTWTGAGIGRNRYNSAAGFPRVNTSLSAQMIRFEESDQITFSAITSGGTSYTHGYMTTGYIASGGSMRSPIFYDLDNTGYYVDPSSATSAVLAGTVTLATVPNYRNTTTIASDYTISATFNEMSIGPITINNGVTVTVDNNANWVIV